MLMSSVFALLVLSIGMTSPAFAQTPTSQADCPADMPHFEEVLDDGKSKDPIEYKCDVCPAKKSEVGGKCVDYLELKRIIDSINLNFDDTSYSAGDIIIITGNVTNYSSDDKQPLAMKIDVGDKRVGVYQIDPYDPNNPTKPNTISDQGTFRMEITADGAYWNTDGNYVVTATYGHLSKTSTFQFSGETSTPTPVECEPGFSPNDDGICVADAPEECDAGFERDIDGDCVPIPPTPVECPEGFVVDDNGECMAIEVEPECGADEELVNGECVAITPTVTCGPGTQPDENGICVVIPDPECPPGYTYNGEVCVEDGGGCLVATAAYGTELAPQVQLLREIRDNTLFSTASGTAFMSSFNTVYYSFAPTIADWERENPLFKEAVKTVITPMLSTLSIMSLADQGSEVEVLGLGISIIALNLGMYIAAPALVAFKVGKIIKSRR